MPGVIQDLDGWTPPDPKRQFDAREQEENLRAAVGETVWTLLTGGGKEMETLGDALPKEMARVRKVLGHYKEIGPAGAFGALMIENTLRQADKAVMSGDLSAMIAAYKELQEIKD